MLAKEQVTSWKLRAFKYYFMPLKDVGLGGILIEPTADLVRLQKELIGVLAPFAAPAKRRHCRRLRDHAPGS